MAFDEALADRVRALGHGFDERKMFGGLALMSGGHMVVAVMNGGLIVRTGAEGRAAALKEPHVAEMDMSGRTMKGFVVVHAEGLRTKRQLQSWVDAAARFVATSLPAK